MAESSNEQPNEASPDPVRPDPAPEDSAPVDPSSEDGPSEVEPTLALLSQPRRDLLTRVAEVLQEYGPKPGALNDLPQVSVPAESIVAVCRRAKDDPELADFYGSLFESEAGHHAAYVRCARDYASHDEVDKRLHELACQEAEIIAVGDSLPRMHS